MNYIITNPLIVKIVVFFNYVFISMGFLALLLMAFSVLRLLNLRSSKDGEEGEEQKNIKIFSNRLVFYVYMFLFSFTMSFLMSTIKAFSIPI